MLLPIWSVQYRFAGKLYTVLVHGQSGKVVGQAPWSFAKIGLFVLAIALAIGLIVLVAGGAGLFA